MIEAILFDLDDTLLGNDIDVFIPHYFGLLGKYAAERIEPQAFFRILQTGTDAVINSRDTAVSNREVFWSTFKQLSDQDPIELEPFFNIFYATQFNQLERFTTCLPAAKPLIQTCFAKGLKVVIATNPLFPLSAIEARLRWAHIPVTEFDYDLVTTYTNMHAAKPNQEYYEEILATIDCRPEKALMVGDNWINDIKPASALGLYTFGIDLPGKPDQDLSLPTASGTLEVLYAHVQADWLETLGV